MTEEKIKRNIANYLVLPWLQLNESSFGSSNFINSYIGTGNQIVVEVRDKTQVPYKYYEDSSFVNDYDTEDRTVIIYELPLEFHDDLTKFVDGKYSRFSEQAKKYIRNFSGLVGGHYYYHVIDRSKELRLRLEADLGYVKPFIDPEAELHDKPKMSEFHSSH